MILAYVDHVAGRPDGASLEAATVARGIAESIGLPLHAATMPGGRVEAGHLAEQLGAFGAATVHAIEHERLLPYVPSAWGAGVAALIEELRPEVVVAAGTDRGHELMADVGARLGLPMAANCVEIRPGDPFEVTRLRWGGSLLEDSTLEGWTKLVTVPPHTAPAEETAAAAVHVRSVSPALTDEDFLARPVAGAQDEAKGVSLGDARVVIGGGRGVGSPEGFRGLEELAELLGGVVGCSRVITSLGWRPHTDQVGQTGTRIAPDIYVACGISGATQHMVGCKGAKRILAINTDPDAPIMSQADYAVVGDVSQVLPAVISQIRARLR
jgi:electron transfer flavoprotein alpha subunit